MRAGQMLVEIVLAIAVAVLVLVGLARLSTGSLSTSNFSRSKSQADAYAQAAVEEIRNQRNALGWSGFGSYSCDALDGTVGNGFTRDANCDRTTPGKVTVMVTVSWAEAGRTSNVKQTTVLNQY